MIKLGPDPEVILKSTGQISEIGRGFKSHFRVERTNIDFHYKILHFLLTFLTLYTLILCLN